MPGNFPASSSSINHTRWRLVARAQCWMTARAVSDAITCGRNSIARRQSVDLELAEAYQFGCVGHCEGSRYLLEGTPEAACAGPGWVRVVFLDFPEPLVVFHQFKSNCPYDQKAASGLLGSQK